MSIEGGDIDPKLLEQLFQVVAGQGFGLKTNVTKTTHRTTYPAISPTRAELSQEGRTVLITGGGTGIGLAIAKAFAQAGAQRIIIIGRRAAVLDEAREKIRTAAPEKAGLEVIGRSCDVTDKSAVAALWGDLKTEGVQVDVLVLNAAKFGVFGSLLDVGADQVWAAMEANVHGPLMFAEAFSKQGGDKFKSIVNISTQSIFQFKSENNALSHLLPDYALSKNAGTLAMQLIAAHNDPQKLQVVSLHPGVVYAGGWESAGVLPTQLPFDDDSLPAGTALWAASPEARFLHGRYIWASWDVEELKSGELRQKLDADPDLLQLGVHGLNGDANRKW